MNIKKEIINEIQKVILGKELQIKLAFVTFLAKGHLLIEDIPGVGKTTLAKAMAKVLNLQYGRIQFTSDMLPSDILGVNIYNPKEHSFSFKKGSIFSQFLLADEINRSTPKTQSALLEAMEEQQVTIDGVTRELPKPFFVIATQNPQEEVGVFELPKSQLDRFFICINIGYPDMEAEKKIIKGEKVEDLSSLKSFEVEKILKMQDEVEKVIISESLVNYLHNIITYTRNKSFNIGISTRGVIILSKMAKAWAFIENRNFVLPEDIQTLLPHIISHRIKKVDNDLSSTEIAKEIIKAINID